MTDFTAFSISRAAPVLTLAGSSTPTSPVALIITFVRALVAILVAAIGFGFLRNGGVNSHHRLEPRATKGNRRRCTPSLRKNIRRRSGYSSPTGELATIPEEPRIERILVE